MNRIFPPVLLIIFLSSCQIDRDRHTPLQFDRDKIIEEAGENCVEANEFCTTKSLKILKTKEPDQPAEKIVQTIEGHVL